MKVLFSPSEAKTTGGDHPPLKKESFCCQESFEKRQEVMNRYEALIQGGDTGVIKKLTGLKKESELEAYRESLYQQPTRKAITRYSGVAYGYLHYEGLDSNAQAFLDQNVLIFSNLFGPILAKDTIPNYKIKQGVSLDGFKPEKFYHEHFKSCVDSFLESESCILDLRAGFYEKFYTLTLPHITMKFIKGGKVVSHFAKAYRGTILREVALHQAKTEEELMAINFPGVKLVEIQQKKLQKMIVFDVLD